jgi:hypothetical protein
MQREVVNQRARFANRFAYQTIIHLSSTGYNYTSDSPFFVALKNQNVEYSVDGEAAQRFSR